MRKLIAITLLLFIFNSSTYGQDDFTFPKSNDIGLNITNVLSSFLGNSGSETNINAYPFVAKINRGKSAVRVGVGFTFDNTDEVITQVEQFIFNNFQLNARVGWERKKYIGNKFGFYYGLDLISVLKNEETTVSNAVDITSTIKNSLGVGGGPVYGFEYYLNKFMYLGTEGSFYGLYTLTSQKNEFTFNPSINSELKSTQFDAKITAPVSLYVMVRF